MQEYLEDWTEGRGVTVGCVRYHAGGGGTGSGWGDNRHDPDTTDT